MKSKLTKVVSLVMAVAIIISLAMPFAGAANKRTNYGMSYSRVTGNADNAGFPSVKKSVHIGREVYFNFQVDSSQKVKWVEVYTRYSNSSSFHRLGRDTANNYMRYTSFWFLIDPFTSGQKLDYYFRVQYTNGNVWTSNIKTASIYG